MSEFDEYKPELTAKDDASIDWCANFMLLSHAKSNSGYVVSKCGATMEIPSRPEDMSDASKHMSPMVKTLIEDTPEVVVNVKGLAESTIQNVAWYLAYFAGTKEEPRGGMLPKPFVEDMFFENQLTNFEKHFADTLFPKPGATDLRAITGLLHAAHFLQMQPLVEMAACALTFHFRHKTPAEIRDLMADQAPEYLLSPAV